MSKIEEYRNNIQNFANKHKVVFEDEGECGFGRECVGLNTGDNWLDYNPTYGEDYEHIPELYSDKFYDICPEDAYHKHDCVAVLGRSENSLRQLSEWVDKLNELNVSIEAYRTGFTGIQATISGIHGRALKIKQPLNKQS